MTLLNSISPCTQLLSLRLTNKKLRVNFGKKVTIFYLLVHSCRKSQISVMLDLLPMRNWKKQAIKITVARIQHPKYSFFDRTLLNLGFRSRKIKSIYNKSNLSKIRQPNPIVITYNGKTLKSWFQNQSWITNFMAFWSKDEHHWP